MAEGKRRRQFAFDLDTKKLADVFGADHISTAYTQIKDFLLDRDFLHEQGSVYVSHGAITRKSAKDTFNELAEICPWIPECANKFTMTNVARDYDLLAILKVAEESQENEQKAERQAETPVGLKRSTERNLRAEEKAKAGSANHASRTRSEHSER
jgi:virulence-associated protein VapD